MKPFTPIRDDGRSYREVAIDLLKDQQYGAVVTYAAIGAALDLDPRAELRDIQRAAREANRTLLKLHKRGLKNISNVGYRIIEPREHMLVANAHQSKADRAMVRAVRYYEGADLERLTEAERRLHHGQHMLAQALLASHRHLDKRIKRIEDLLDGTKTIDGV